MASRSSRLPSRFPVGTKFVIEGERGGEGQVQVYSRYLEFPDGTFLRAAVAPRTRKSPNSAAVRAAPAPAGLAAGRATRRRRGRQWPTGMHQCRGGAIGHWPLRRPRPMADRGANRQITIAQKKRGPKAPWGIVVVSAHCGAFDGMPQLGWAGLGCRINANPRPPWLMRQGKDPLRPSAQFAKSSREPIVAVAGDKRADTREPSSCS